MSLKEDHCSFSASKTGMVPPARTLFVVIINIVHSRVTFKCIDHKWNVIPFLYCWMEVLTRMFYKLCTVFWDFRLLVKKLFLSIFFPKCSPVRAGTQLCNCIHTEISISVDSYRTETSTSNLRQIQYEYFNFIILFKFVNYKSWCTV